MVEMLDLDHILLSSWGGGGPSLSMISLIGFRLGPAAAWPHQAGLLMQHG